MAPVRPGACGIDMAHATARATGGSGRRSGSRAPCPQVSVRRQSSPAGRRIGRATSDERQPSKWVTTRQLPLSVGMTDCAAVSADHHRRTDPWSCARQMSRRRCTTAAGCLCPMFCHASSSTASTASAGTRLTRSARSEPQHRRCRYRRDGASPPRTRRVARAAAAKLWTDGERAFL